MAKNNAMNFQKSGNYFIVTRQESFLAVVLVEICSVAQTCVTTLPRMSPRGHRLNCAAVVSAVQEGVVEANRAFQTNFQVKQLHYIEDDDRPESLYKQMAFGLVEQIANGVELYEIRYEFTDENSLNEIYDVA